MTSENIGHHAACVAAINGFDGLNINGAKPAGGLQFRFLFIGEIKTLPHISVYDILISRSE